MTTISIVGNHEFCSVSSDTQITEKDTLRISNGLPKVVKVSDNVIIALSRNTEGSVKIFGWNYLELPAKKRDFRVFFNSKFKYNYADDCFETLCSFSDQESLSDVTIYVVGKNSSGGMFYGKYSSEGRKKESEVVKDQEFIKFKSLPVDITEVDLELSHDDYTKLPIQILLEGSVSVSKYLKERQRTFINEVASKSKLSNNDFCNEIVYY